MSQVSTVRSPGGRYHVERRFRWKWALSWGWRVDPGAALSYHGEMAQIIVKFDGRPDFEFTGHQPRALYGDPEFIDWLTKTYRHPVREVWHYDMPYVTKVYPYAEPEPSDPDNAPWLQPRTAPPLPGDLDEPVFNPPWSDVPHDPSGDFDPFAFLVHLGDENRAFVEATIADARREPGDEKPCTPPPCPPTEEVTMLQIEAEAVHICHYSDGKTLAISGDPDMLAAIADGRDWPPRPDAELVEVTQLDGTVVWRDEPQRPATVAEMLVETALWLDTLSRAVELWLQGGMPGPEHRERVDRALRDVRGLEVQTDLRRLADVLRNDAITDGILHQRAFRTQTAGA